MRIISRKALRDHFGNNMSLHEDSEQPLKPHGLMKLGIAFVLENTQVFQIKAQYKSASYVCLHRESL